MATIPQARANPAFELLKYGQSIWYDNMSRGLLASGQFQHLVDEYGVRGVTSNPTIFEKAIVGSADYDGALPALVAAGKQPKEIFEALAIADLQQAADILRDIYVGSNGTDGYVSMEVSPTLAHDTAGTITEAKRLFAALNRPNIMIKIPATVEGLPAITEVIASGINVNVTLMFAVPRYRDVAQAYIQGLERRLQAGQPIDQIASVASFFVSRVDSMVDAQLEAKAKDASGAAATKVRNLQGKAAIANAKIAYAAFQDIFYGARFAAVKAKGGRAQRVLWASTSTKNPSYPDTYYVSSLIGPDTVNTMPHATLEAWKDHGVCERSVDVGLDQAKATLKALDEAGIDMEQVTGKLLDEGVSSFSKSFETLLAAIEKKAKALAATK